MRKDFNKISLNLSLFKGQFVWYYSYIKSEKLAQVLTMLHQRTSFPSPLFDSLLAEAARLPSRLVHMMAGELKEETVLADIFSLMSGLRTLTIQGSIGRDNTSVLIQEYEHMVERIAEARKSGKLLVTPEHLTVSLPAEEGYDTFLPVPLGFPAQPVKDIYKGHNKSHDKDTAQGTLKGHEGSGERMVRILEIIRKNNGISIKGISSVVRDCSEKTIQRELGTLIERGLVTREGERRWSIYKAAVLA